MADAPGDQQQWRYATTWVREWKEGDKEEVDAHLDKWARAGWELINGCPLWLLSIQSAQQGPDRTFSPVFTEGTGVIRHYFYWRRAAQE